MNVNKKIIALHAVVNKIELYWQIIFDIKITAQYR